MARRPSTPQPVRPTLTVEQKLRRIDRLHQCIGELEKFDPNSVQKRWAPEVRVIETAIDEALSAAFGHGTIEYNRYSRATDLDHGPVSVVPDYNFGGGRQYSDGEEARRYLAEGKQEAILMLGRAIATLHDEIADDQLLREAAVAPTTAARSFSKNNVFVVHGHDEAALQEVARFLEKIELPAIVLREQPDRGRTVIEKFEDCANEVGFAVVLLTPDDIAGTSDAPANRARQNVIFELGYFAGKLGRGCACLLRKGQVEIPSDLYGVIYKDFDVGGGWKIELIKELKAAGLNFDANKVWG